MENNSNTPLDFNSIKEKCNIITYISLGQIISTMILKFIKASNSIETTKYTLFKAVKELSKLFLLNDNVSSISISLSKLFIITIPIIMLVLSIFMNSNSKILTNTNIVVNAVRLVLLLLIGYIFKSVENYVIVVKLCMGYHLNIILTIASIIYSVYINKISSNNT